MKHNPVYGKRSWRYFNLPSQTDVAANANLKCCFDGWEE